MGGSHKKVGLWERPFGTKMSGPWLCWQPSKDLRCLRKCQRQDGVYCVCVCVPVGAHWLMWIILCKKFDKTELKHKILAKYLDTFEIITQLQFASLN